VGVVGALAGAVVGGLMTGYFTYLIERRRDRRDKKREKATRRNLVKQAARVVDAELEQAETSARSAVERQEWWPNELGPIEVGSWNQYRAVLASKLSLDDWRVVAAAFGFIHGINSAWLRPVYKPLSLLVLRITSYNTRNVKSLAKSLSLSGLL